MKTSRFSRSRSRSFAHETWIVEIRAVCDGRCGVLDTTAHLITPIDLRDPWESPNER